MADGKSARDETRKRFDEVASTYDTSFVRLIDRYEEMQTAMTALVARARPDPRRILDLGTGTGGMARLMLERFPAAGVHGVDFSVEMVSRARSNLASFGDRFTVEVSDLAEYEPAGPFDVIVSALAIHHLTDAEKEALTRRACDSLSAGGAFVNGDLVRGETPKEQETLEALHVESMRSKGLPEPELQERLDRHRRHDVPARLSDQLRWLREAGCAEAWVPWRHLYQAVVVGLR